MSDGVPAGTPFVWLQAEKRQEAQIRQADALDTKATALVGLHALAAGLAASFVERATGPARWVALTAILGLVLSGGLALLAFWTEAYDRNPSPEDMWLFGAREETEIMHRFLSARFQALDWNRRKLEAKARKITLSLVGFGVVALIVGIAAVVGLVRVR